jgi:hypothetical protein
MNVAQLKEMLESFPDDMEVKFGYDSKDYWHTPVAADINGGDERFVKYSDYHRMDKVVQNEEQEDFDEGEPVSSEEGATKVLILCTSQFD